VLVADTSMTSRSLAIHPEQVQTDRPTANPSSAAALTLPSTRSPTQKSTQLSIAAPTAQPAHLTSAPTFVPSFVPTSPPTAAPSAAAHCPERPCDVRTPWYSPANGTCHRGRDYADYIVCMPNSSHPFTAPPASPAVNGTASPTASRPCPEHHAFAYSGNGIPHGFCCETDRDVLGVRRHPWDLSAVRKATLPHFTGTGLTAATSASGPGSPLPQLLQDCAHRGHICNGTGSPQPHLRRDWGSLLLHLRRDWARPCHICAGTGLTAAISAPALAQAHKQPTTLRQSIRGAANKHRTRGARPSAAADRPPSAPIVLAELVRAMRLASLRR
jgi:hypothetical protein